MRKSHILVLGARNDWLQLHPRVQEMFEFIIFIADLRRHSDDHLFGDDDMPCLRRALKEKYNVRRYGGVFVIDPTAPPPYQFLKEWLLLPAKMVLDLERIDTSIDVCHVCVFDLDSTLVTEQSPVNIRSSGVIDSLKTLRQRGVYLVLWSYGSAAHVVQSMVEAKIDARLFGIILCEGDHAAASSVSETPANTRTVFQIVDDAALKSVIPVDVPQREGRRLPKSVKVVQHFLLTRGVITTRTFTLVDDLEDNQLNYDYFVKVARAPEPVDDWAIYHNTVLDNLAKFDTRKGTNNKRLYVY